MTFHRLRTLRYSLISAALVGLALLAGLAMACDGNSGNAALANDQEDPNQDVKAAPSPTRTPDSVTIEDLTSLQIPFAEVTIEIDLRKERIQVTPDPVVVWFDSENPISQILWAVRCIDGVGHEKKDVVCPDYMGVTIRPKRGCSPRLFGDERYWEKHPDGAIPIQPGDNAIASGPMNARVVEQLFRAKEENPALLCDGRRMSKEEMAAMVPQGARDGMWVYQVIVSRSGEELFKLDPGVWIEKDG